ATVCRKDPAKSAWLGALASKWGRGPVLIACSIMMLMGLAMMTPDSLIMIGAGQLSQYLCQMALAADYQIVVIDPRDEFAEGIQFPGVEFSRGMPDDELLRLGIDQHSAVVALTHDPKLDDMALIEALKSPAFYIGALGSRANTAKRKERLKLFDLSEEEIARLYGPVGLFIGAKTPPEMAISILAELTAAKYGVEILQRREPQPTEKSACMPKALVQ
ncbi:MAG: hypothetical protein EBW88_12545, partial [Betaproteobacteria bacterium]|nr:hypothetical protein [Betaproteobacteria bacterium]